MKKKKKLKPWEIGFADGLWYAIQQVCIYESRWLALWIAIESGLKVSEFKKSQKESGYEDEEMQKLLTQIKYEQKPKEKIEIKAKRKVSRARRR